MAGSKGKRTWFAVGNLRNSYNKVARHCDTLAQAYTRARDMASTGQYTLAEQAYYQEYEKQKPLLHVLDTMTIAEPNDYRALARRLDGIRQCTQLLPPEECEDDHGGEE